MATFNPFRDAAISAKRKHHESYCPDPAVDRKASRPRQDRNTSTPRRSQGPQSARKENVKPSTKSPASSPASRIKSPRRVFAASARPRMSYSRSSQDTHELYEEDQEENEDQHYDDEEQEDEDAQDATLTGSEDESDEDVEEGSFVSDEDAQEQEADADNILPTIERDDDHQDYDSDGYEVYSEDEDYEPEPQETDEEETVRTPYKKWYSDDLTFTPIHEESEEDEFLPARSTSKKPRVADPTYKPAPEELDEEELFRPSFKDKKPRVPLTSSPIYKREDFYDDDDEVQDDDMEVIPESDEEEESDWEIEGDTLEVYRDGIKSIASYHAWCREDKKLHKTLFLRGLHPLMPTTWNFDFLGYPIPPELFAPRDSEKQVLIYNKTPEGQYRTTKALRGLFDLQGRVTALRQIGAKDKISPIIQKELSRYVKSVLTEAGLDKYDFAPTIRVRRFDYKKKANQDLAKTVDDYFVKWAEKHRAWYALRKLKAPRLLYGLVVVQHAVMLLTIDSARPDAKPRPFTDFSMSAEQQWLDSALNIAIPIFLARDRLLQLAPGFPLAPPPESDHDDD